MKPLSHLRIAPFILLAASLIVPTARAATITLPAVKDNTLLRYDPADANTALNSNGIGDFFSAGRTFSRDEIRRGLIQFDLSSIPVGSKVVPGSVQLQLRVIGIPRRDTTPRPFWVVGLDGLTTPWGEGASEADVAVSGSGSGAPAQLGDATWFHTSYNPAVHNATDFTPAGAGFWNEKGAISNTFIADPAALFGPAAGISGSTEDFVNFSSASMENDINTWLADPSKNFGWIVIGDENVSGPDASSKRDFASREHANPDFHPVLTFAVVPEPSTMVMIVLAIASLYLHRSRCNSPLAV